MESSASNLSGTATAAPNSSIETLPTELKLEILELVPDLKSMGALVHASPSYHQLYVAERERTLTRLTLADLAERGIELPEHRMAILDYSVRDGFPSRRLQETLRAYYSQLASKVRFLRLKVWQCIELLNLSDVVCWWATENDVGCSRLLNPRCFMYTRILSRRQFLRNTYMRYVGGAVPAILATVYPDGYLNYDSVDLVDNKELLNQRESENEGKTDKAPILVLRGDRWLHKYCRESVSGSRPLFDFI